MTSPVLVYALIVMLSIALEAESKADAPLVCDCSGRLASLTVCGTDGFSYHNVCLLKEAQQTDPDLGRRCIGECPCQQETIPSFCSHRAVETEFQGFRQSDFDNNFDPEYMVDIIGVEHAPYGEEHLKRCFFGGNQRPSSLTGNQNAGPAAPSDGSAAASSGRFSAALGPSPLDPVCLTNGTTVANMKVAYCLLKSTANKALGVRCLGDCSVCAKEPPCPVPRKALSATHG